MRIDAILVPHGAEMRAVRRGISQRRGRSPRVISIPVGPEPVRSHLEQLQQSPQGLKPQSNAILMGLCGSLSPQLSVGDCVICQRCIQANGASVITYACDRPLSEYLMQQMLNTPKFATCFTSDRLVESAAAKRQLGETYQADVVDMEGAAILAVLQGLDVNVAMLRVVSDDCDHDLPTISVAIDRQGRLQTLPLVGTLITQPQRAIRLVQSSLQALAILQQRTADLVSPSLN